MTPIPYAPWCWYIYLQNWVIIRANVGKYSIPGAHGNSGMVLTINIGIIDSDYISGDLDY